MVFQRFYSLTAIEHLDDRVELAVKVGKAFLHSLTVRQGRVLVPDAGSKEIDEPPTSALAGVGDCGKDSDPSLQVAASFKDLFVTDA